MVGRVVAVSQSSTHSFSKTNRSAIELEEGVGVVGDAHAGTSVKHRSRVAVDPTQPNLRQVHLIHSELHKELLLRVFRIAPGDMGENVTTEGVDVLSLPPGTILRFGDAVGGAAVRITGLRTPCGQLNGLHDGLMQATLARSESGELVRKAGIMAVVERRGLIRVGDSIVISLPPTPHDALQPV